jgi:hypothetical protein
VRVVFVLEQCDPKLRGLMALQRLTVVTSQEHRVSK